MTLVPMRLSVDLLLDDQTSTTAASLPLFLSSLVYQPPIVVNNLVFPSVRGLYSFIGKSFGAPLALLLLLFVSPSSGQQPFTAISCLSATPPPRGVILPAYPRYRSMLSSA